MPVSNKPLRLLSLFLLAGLLLAGCAPQARTVANSVMPQIFNARYADGQLHLQGRYLGHGSGGIDAGHYVLLGADVDGTGGLAYEATSWSDSRVTVSVPADAPTGNVFVVAGGQRSNQLTWRRD